MKVVTQNYIGTTEEWKQANPVLYKAVWGFEITKDGNMFVKVGNGKDRWNDLKYFDRENIDGLPGELTKIRDIADRALRIANNASPSYPVELNTEKPTQEELQAVYEKVSGLTGEPDDLVMLEDLAFHKTYKYYTAQHEWVDMGAIGISIFTNQSIGGIMGFEEPGFISAAGSGRAQVAGWNELVNEVNDKVDKMEGNRLITSEETAKLQSINANPYGSTLPPGVILSCVINDGWLPMYRLIKLEGQIVDISEDSPYYMMGKIIYVGDAYNNNPDLEGFYKINSSGQRDINGTKMVLPDGRGMFLRGAGANSRHFPSVDTLYDGKEPGTFSEDKLKCHSHPVIYDSDQFTGQWQHNPSHYGITQVMLIGEAIPNAFVGPNFIGPYGDIENAPASTSVYWVISY